MIFSRIHWTLARGPPLLSESIHGVVKGLEITAPFDVDIE